MVIAGADYGRENRAQYRALLNEINVPATAQIGVIGPEPYPPFYFDSAMPFNTLAGIKEAYPQAAIVPVYRDYFVRVSVKSEEELAHIRHAAAMVRQ